MQRRVRGAQKHLRRLQVLTSRLTNPNGYELPVRFFKHVNYGSTKRTLVTIPYLLIGIVALVEIKFVTEITARARQVFLLKKNVCNEHVVSMQNWAFGG